MTETTRRHRNAGTRLAPTIMTLEPRIMFDGAAAVDVAAAAVDAQDSPVTVREAVPVQNSGRKEVAFIDTAVADWQSLVAGVRSGIEVVLVESTASGMAQMAEWAGTHSGFDAIHVLSHGAEGVLALGTDTLTQAGLADDSMRDRVAALGQALTTDGDLLLYGCSVGSGPTGSAFVRALAEASGADVAASEDLTGSAANGGDWELEATVGAIDAQNVLADQGWDELGHVLAQVANVTFSGNGSSGTLSDSSANVTIRQFGTASTLFVDNGNTYTNATTAIGTDATYGDYWRYTTSGTLGNGGDKGGGFQVKAPLGNGKTYTVGLKFSVDNVTSGTPADNYVKIIDFWNGTTDDGIYLGHESGDNSYPLAQAKLMAWVGGSGGAPVGFVGTPPTFSNGDVIDIVMIRNDSTDLFQIYMGSGASGSTYTKIVETTDTNEDFVFATASGLTTLGFFFDDNLANGAIEASSGKLFKLKIWDSVETTNSVQTALVAAANAGPTVTINNATLAYTENGTATQIDSAGTVTDTDGDAEWTGGTLKAQITANNEADDEISISDTDGDGTAITVSGTNIFANGTDIGDLSASGGTVTNGTALTITFDADATNANVQEVLQSLRYRNTSDAPGTSNRTITITATDKNAGAGTGTRTVSVTAVNDAPTVATNTGVTLNEGATSAIAVGQLDEGDPDDSGTGLTYTVTTTVANGQLWVDSDGNGAINGAEAAIANSGTFTQQDIADGKLKYKHGGAETTSDSFAFSLADGGENGAAAVTGQTFSITVTPVNDAPVMGGTAGATWTENTSAGGSVDSGASVSLFSSASMSDPDTTTSFNGATFTVALSAYRTGDRISVPATSGTVTFNQGSSTVSVSGTAMGTVAGGSEAPLVITFNGNATKAAIDAVVNAIVFTIYGNDSPTADGRAITATFSDNANGGAGALTGTLTGTLTVSATNDPPTLTATAASPGYTENAGAVALFTGATIGTVDSGQNIDRLILTVASLADGASERLTVDGTEFNLVDAVSGTSAANSFQYAVSVTGTTATITLTKTDTAANWQTAVDGIKYRNASENPTAGGRAVTLTSVRDTGGTANSGTDTTTLAVASTVTVTAVNDAPTVTNNGLTGAQKGLVTAITTAKLTETDPDDSGTGLTYTVTTNVARGTLWVDADGSGTVNNAEAGLTNGGTFTQQDLADGKLKYLHDNTANFSDSFVFSLADGGEDGAAALTNQTFNIGIIAAPEIDLDADNSTGATGGNASRAFTENGTAVLLADAGIGATLTDDGANLNQMVIELTNSQTGDLVTLNGRTTGTTVNGILITYDSASKVTLSGSATKADYLALLQEAQFSNNSENPNTTARTITIAGRDTDGNTGPTVTATITVTAVNDAPTVTNNGLTLNEGATATITTAKLTETDPDDSGTGLTYTVTTTAANGTLWLDANANASMDAGEDLTNTETFTEQDIADGKLKYTHNGGETISASFVLSLADGGEDAAAALTGQTFNITVTPVNDAPALGGTFTTAGTVNDNATTQPFSAVTVTDAESNNATLTVTFTGANGELTAAGSPAWLTRNSAGTFSLAATDPATQTTRLQSLVFTPTANQVTSGGTVQTTFTVTPADTDTGSANATTVVTATSVNDAPTLGGTFTTNGAINDTATATPFASVTVADVDSSNVSATITYTAANGTLASAGGGLTGSAGSYTLTSDSKANIQTKLQALVFTPTANQVAPTSTVTTTFTVTLNDGTANGTPDATTQYVVTSVQDAPVNTVPGAQTTNEDVAVTFTGGTLLSIADPDSSQTITTTLSVGAGTGTIAVTTGGGATITGQGSNSVQIQGTAAQVNAALASVAYTPTANASGVGYATLTMATSDGTTTDTDTVTINVTAVNDAPVNTMPGSVTIQEDGTATLAFSVADIDTANVTATLTITGGTTRVAAGSGATVTNDGTASITIAGTKGQVNAALSAVIYTPAGVGTGTIQVVTTDGSGGSDTDSVTVTVEKKAAPPVGNSTTTATTDTTTTKTITTTSDSTDKGADGLRTVVRDTTPITTTKVDTFAPVTVTAQAPANDAQAQTQQAPQQVAQPTIAAAAPTVQVVPAALTTPAPQAFQVAVAVKPAGGGDALVINAPVKDAVIAEGNRISVTVPAEAFAHTKADAVVTLVATRGDGAALPGWMAFNPQTGTFEGNPPPGFRGEVVVKVVARDAEGREAVQTFKIVVGQAGQGNIAPGQGGEGRGQGQPQGGEGEDQGQGQPQAPGQTGDAGQPAKHAAKPVGRASLTAQLRELSQEGRLAKQAALFGVKRASKAA